MKKLCVGQFVGAHGVRGLVKLRSFTENPESIFDYAPLLSDDGKHTFKITAKSADKDHFIVTVDGIADRDAANALRGDKVYIPRDILPPPSKGEGVSCSRKLAIVMPLEECWSLRVLWYKAIKMSTS